MSTEADSLFGEQGGASRPPRRRKKKAPSKPVFKPYEQHQTVLLPQSLEEMIPQQHLVRVVNTTIDKMDVGPLLASYKGGGTSAYHPVMLLKVFVYGYLMKLYTSRRLAKALREDIHFMWLAGMQRPDFRTLNLFRSSRLKTTIDAVFTTLVTFLDQEHLINLETYFVDGTTIEANANKHTAVWAKNTRRYKQRTLAKVQALLARIDTLVHQENLHYGERDLEELGTESTLTAEKLASHVAELKTMLREQQQQEHEQPGQVTRRLEAAVRTLEEKHLAKLVHYEEQEHRLGTRNSYARSDPDATMLRTKTGQLLPAYMIVAGTQNQFLLHYSLHQRASESDAFLPHLRELTKRHGRLPSSIVADAAYGSEENYDVLAQAEVTAYLKYSTYDQERKKRRVLRYDRQDFSYEPEQDAYRCPQGRRLGFLREQADTTRTGYKTRTRLYQCESCDGCPVQEQCLRGKGPRTVSRNPRLEAFRHEARERLSCEEGIALYRQRGTEPESVFGDVKENQGFRRFHLRGVAKINVEVGLLGLAHNIKKLFGRPT
jgi:transposase